MRIDEAEVSDELRAPFQWFGAPSAVMSALLCWYHDGRLLEKWQIANGKATK